MNTIEWPRSAVEAAERMGAPEHEVRGVLDAGDVTVQHLEHVAVVTLNRPSSRNAMTLAMWRTMPAILAGLERDPQVRALILTGAGSDFCAGADIPEFDRVRDDVAQATAYEDAVDACCDAIAQFNKPSIAVLRGYCLGGGAHLAMSCDFRHAARDAVFGIPAARLSIIYGVKGTLKLLSLVGLPAAKRIFFTAERFDAEKALAIGFIDEISRDSENGPGDPMADALALARSMTPNAPLTQRGSKALLNAMAWGTGALDLARAQALIDEAAASQDYREGRMAFAQRRAANFKGC